MLETDSRLNFRKGFNSFQFASHSEEEIGEVSYLVIWKKTGLKGPPLVYLKGKVKI